MTAAQNATTDSSMLEMTTNATSNLTMASPPYGGVDLTLVAQVINTLLLVFLMISMGVTIDIKDIKETFRHPAAFFIGMASQFILMPLIGFCMALAFRLDIGGALSVLIVSCSPGGTLSNLFSYWTNGDVCLSVSMTTVSTAVAIGMFPLNLYIYTRVWTSKSSVIPYVNIVTTLVTILIPALFGVFLRWLKEKWMKWVTRVCLVFAILLIGGSYAVAILLNPNVFYTGWPLWVCAALLPLVGFTIGYILALILRQPHPKCRTIAFETGSQNVALAFTIIVLSFSGTPYFLQMLIYPALYGIFILMEPLVLIGLYRVVALLRNDHGSDVDSAREDRSEMDGHDNERTANHAYSQDVETEMEEHKNP